MRIFLKEIPRDKSVAEWRFEPSTQKLIYILHIQQSRHRNRPPMMLWPKFWIVFNLMENSGCVKSHLKGLLTVWEQMLLKVFITSPTCLVAPWESCHKRVLTFWKNRTISRSFLTAPTFDDSFSVEFWMFSIKATSLKRDCRFFVFKIAVLCSKKQINNFMKEKSTLANFVKISR